MPENSNPEALLQAHVKAKANLIWSVADKLRSVFKANQYGSVILPLVVIKRFDSVLESTKAAVLARAQSLSPNLVPALRDEHLRQVTGTPFYNLSPYTLKSLLDAPADIAANFQNYLDGFSQNVCEIIERFHFSGPLERLVSNNLLYEVIKTFTSPDADLHPDRISNLEMGYIFEELIRRFSEDSNEEAGEHYTPREVIQLMVNILFCNDNEILSEDGACKTIYDPTAGTGGMLSVAQERLAKLNATAQLLPYGQEVNDETFAICKSDMLIKGDETDHIACGNTLSNDAFPQDSFNYILSNPPFGVEWKTVRAAVEAEARLGANGRFGMGLPPISDGQMLFLQLCAAKLRDDGKAAVIQNGSPLFTGDAASGASEIRRALIERDILEAIIALPNDIFYNTGIATYIWVLNKRKSRERRGRIQLINAAGEQFFVKRRKALGNKRNDIPKHAIEEITKIYETFEENEFSKIFNNEDFGYTKITVERPARDARGNVILKRGVPVADPKLRDTENVPFTRDIDEYFRTEILPFAPDAWLDRSKDKIGYEIPFTRYFYQYTPPKKSDEVLAEINALRERVDEMMKQLF